MTMWSYLGLVLQTQCFISVCHTVAASLANQARSRFLETGEQSAILNTLSYTPAQFWPVDQSPVAFMFSKVTKELADETGRCVKFVDGFVWDTRDTLYSIMVNELMMCIQLSNTGPGIQGLPIVQSLASIEQFVVFQLTDFFPQVLFTSINCLV